MLYLSRLILNPRSRQVQRDLADCQRLHQRIMAAFPPTHSGSEGARAAHGVLYRAESPPRSGGPLVLLVQSRIVPDWSRLPTGYLLADTGERRNPETKRVDTAYGALRTGMRLVFRLRANPTKRLPTPKGADGQRPPGKRVELFTEAKQIAWLAAKGEQSGFALTRVRARAGGPAVGGDGEVPNAWARPGGKVIGWRGSAPAGEGGSGAMRLTFGAVLFEGELEVMDAERFRQVLEQGVGPGKAYGFGLLSVAPSG